MPLRTLIVDFNSFFASVEQQERPELRGRPVAVAPVAAESTGCIAASQAAKIRGVKTGTRVAEARRLCPGLTVLEARPELYVRYHRRLVEIIERCAHVTQVLSIDEVACDLTATFARPDRAGALARRIKQAVAREAGACLTSSIGIAPNALLAKAASDMQKPDGLVVLDDADLPHRLYVLALTDIPGIGERLAARLRARGIDTVEKLFAAPRPQWRQLWSGVEGERMFERLHGREVPLPPARTRSIGHSHVLPPDLRHEAGALATLHRLLQKAAMRLRHAGCCAGGLQLGLHYLRRERWSDAVTFNDTQDTLELIRVFTRLWARRPRTDAAFLAVGLTLFNLVPAAAHTRALFGGDDTRDALNTAVDQLNQKLGKNTVVYGGALGALRFAPMRIAFNRIPDPAIEEGGPGARF